VTVAKLGCSATRIRLKALLLQQGRDPLGVRRADPLKDSERAAERRDPFSRPAVQKLAPADTASIHVSASSRAGKSVMCCGAPPTACTTMGVEAMQVSPGSWQPDAVQGSSGLAVHVRTWVQAEPAEHSPLLFGKILIRQVEGSRDR